MICHFQVRLWQSEGRSLPQNRSNAELSIYIQQSTLILSSLQLDSATTLQEQQRCSTPGRYAHVHIAGNARGCIRGPARGGAVGRRSFAWQVCEKQIGRIYFRLCRSLLPCMGRQICHRGHVLYYLRISGSRYLLPWLE